MSGPLDRIVVWGLAVTFFAAAAAFALLPDGSSVPLADPVTVQPEDIDPSPRFEILGDPPLAMINGFKRTCMDCHAIIDQEPHSKDLFQHKNIRLEHGLNTSCVNCHSAADRNKLGTTGDSKTFTFNQVAELCAQCHGPVYRQWERGTHGKTLGYWNPAHGDSRRLTCTECHDPHHPRFDPMVPLPGPHTLRMGPQESGDAHHSNEGKKRNPLLLPAAPSLGTDHSPSTADENAD